MSEAISSSKDLLNQYNLISVWPGQERVITIACDVFALQAFYWVTSTKKKTVQSKRRKWRIFCDGRILASGYNFIYWRYKNLLWKFSLTIWFKLHKFNKWLFLLQPINQREQDDQNIHGFKVQYMDL